MTRSTYRWKELPGSFDTVNTRWLFPSDNQFDIPLLRPNTGLKPPETLIPYRTRLRDKALLAKSGLHFWLDDYRFEAVWSRPFQTLAGLTDYGAVLTPDFSLYRDQPLAVQIWQTYRTRWLGAFWQAHALPVIPTVSWSNTKSR